MSDKRLGLLVLVLAGCPAPPAPAPEHAPPPPVAVLDAAPVVVPAVIAVRVDHDVLEVIRVDATGDTRVLHQLGRAAALPSVADLAVDPASGRYALLVEADTVDGAKVKTPRDVISLVLGSIDGGVVAVASGDPTCVMHRCFESTIALAPGGDTLVTWLHRSSATELDRYDFGARPAPARLTAKGVERPALSPDHRLIAFVRGGAIHVAEVGAATSIPVATGVADVVALVLGDRRLAYRTGSGAVVIVDTDTQVASTTTRLGADPQPALRIAGNQVLTTDGGNVVAASVDGGDWRALATGALIDVSADGAWLLASDGALSVVSTADGRVWASHDVRAAFGEVRARLAP